MRFRIIFACLLDLVVWGIAFWILTARPGEPLAPRAYHHTARVCWALASYFGSIAIEAETAYWKAIRT